MRKIYLNPCLMNKKYKNKMDKNKRIKIKLE